jgi:hypothetical protein
LRAFHLSEPGAISTDRRRVAISFTTVSFDTIHPVGFWFAARLME